jgi:hypothetical protein
MIFSRNELRSLIETTGKTVVSIYMPTHRTGDNEQDRIRLRNILHEAEKKLVDAGLRTPEATNIIKPAAELLENNEFWQHQSDGLALFLSPDIFRYYRLPYAFQQTMILSKRCYVRPMLTLLHNDGIYYVLALSQNSVRFLQCTRDSHRVITPDSVPRNIAEALKYDEPEKQLQFHTTGAGPAIFHGHGVSKDYDKVSISRYFRQVDRGLHEMLREEKAPMVVVAVDYLHPLYRKANTYTHLLDRAVTGNPDEMSETEIRQQAWTVVESVFAQSQTRALSDFQEASGKGLAVSDIKQALLAAHDGRMSVLIIAVGLQQWGSFDEATRKIRLYRETRPGAEDLFEAVSVYTLTGGGDVYALPPENIPSNTGIAGILRY